MARFRVRNQQSTAGGICRGAQYGQDQQESIPGHLIPRIQGVFHTASGAAHAGPDQVAPDGRTEGAG